MPRTISHPAFIELKQEGTSTHPAGIDTTFAKFRDVCGSSELQRRVVDKRQFRNAVNRPRRAGATC